MSATPENRSVRELAMLQPALREDLRFTVQEQGGRRFCVIEDPTGARFHRVGLDEYCFLRTLDGLTSVAALIALQASHAEGETLTQSDAMQIIHWAKANHLLTLDRERTMPSREPATRALGTLAAWLNPLSIKLPLGRPDVFFRWAAGFLRPALNGFGLFIWLVVLAAAAAHLAPEWTQFRREADGFLARDNWLWISLGWVLLKVTHECGHAVICRHFGAPVREIGVMFILGMPLGYVDATASLALPSRRQRIAVAAAGLGAEFLLAALAAIVWTRTTPGALHTLSRDMVITGTVLTLFFNANPLMRYDGYFIAADLLDVPNLSTRGRQWMGQAWHWLFLGGPAKRPARPRRREEWIVAVYGAASSVWQMVVMAGLLMAASVLLKGGGLLFAAIAAVFWIATPLVRVAQELHRSVKSGISGWSSLVVRVTFAGGLAALLLFVPWRRTVSEAGVVELAETEVLRAECAGFVDRLFVSDGAEVAAGDLLVELRNDEVAAQLRRSRLEKEQQELKARLAYNRQDVATFQAESAKAASLRESLGEQENFMATLQVRAPFAGKVTSRQLGHLTGRFFKPGEEILRIGRAGPSEIKIAVTERNEPPFRAALGQHLQIRIAGHSGALGATLTRIDGHATRENAWPALTAMTGGPIALRKTEPGSPQPYELADPFFTATALLNEDAGLLPGETGQVRFRSANQETLWEELTAGVNRWVAKYSKREG